MTPGTPEYEALGIKIFSTALEQLWVIGDVGMLPTPLIAVNGLRNIPDPDYILGAKMANPFVIHWADQLYKQ